MNITAQHTDNDIKYWLALLRTPGVGCRTFLRLLESHTP
ncbi:MAG: hypothetical protein ACXWFI_12975, partial [Methylobacter sp.]